MTDLTQTAANVASQAGATVDKSRIAGEAITAGMPVYISTTDGKAYKADANASLATAAVYGIAVSNAAGAGAPIAIQTGGDINLGATLTVNTAYIASSAAGAIAPIADLTTGWSAALLGVAISTSILRMPTSGPIITGVAS